MKRRRYYRAELQALDIPSKANRILNLLLVGMLLIVVRIWHLAFIQYDDKIEEARKPCNKVFVEPAKRATIRDRFNIPLAGNRVQYQVAIVYGQLREVPSVVWQKDESGKRVKKFFRREYITKLSKVLAEILHDDAERIEDLIHAKASFHNHIPYIIKKNLSESEYYRLRMIEKDWVGVCTQSIPKRYYPQGRVASDIIGYMGAINRSEYAAIIEEMRILERYISQEELGQEQPEDFSRIMTAAKEDVSFSNPFKPPAGITSLEEAKTKLLDLQEKAYTIQDFVGKAGIEGMFEKQLRGFHGKKSFHSDARGNFLRQLPGAREPLPGQRLLLTISAELQEFAEQLLVQNERIRQAYISSSDGVKSLAGKQPWIKGGAIVALDPHTGEIIAMASYPRMDANDFIASGDVEIDHKKRAHIGRWFESETYLGEIWDQTRHMEREVYDRNTKQFYEEKYNLSWEAYLHFILPDDSAVYFGLDNVATLGQAVILQRHINNLSVLSGQTDVRCLLNHIYQGDDHVAFSVRLASEEKRKMESNLKKHASEVAYLKQQLHFLLSPLTYNYDKLLLVDLCRLCVAEEFFNEELILKVGSVPLSEYRDASAAWVNLTALAKNTAKDLYHTYYFANWRKMHEKNFLKQKRLEEKAAHQYPKPYIDYLDAMERALFQKFWEKNGRILTMTLLKGRFEVQASLHDQEGVLDGPENQEMAQKEEDEDLTPYLNFFSAWHTELKAELELAQGGQAEPSLLESALEDPSDSHKVQLKQAHALLTQSLQGLSVSEALQYVKTMRSFQDLNKPLLGRYRGLRNIAGQQLEKHLAAAFYPRYGFGYGRSHAYRQAALQGSIFKLVTAYETLVQRYKHLQALGESPQSIKAQLNPFEMIDHVHKRKNAWYVGYTGNGEAIPQLYKGGRLPRGHYRSTGKLDLVKALEVSSNPYFSLLAGDLLKNPQDLATAAALFSYGERTGIELPAEITGKVPDDLETNRTGLYAMAIGQHSLVVTPLQTAVMLTTIANGGKVLQPKIVRLTAGREPLRAGHSVHPNNEVGTLLAMPNKAAECPSAPPARQASLVHLVPTRVKRTLFMPENIRVLLLEGMRRVVVKSQAEGLNSLIKLYKNHPEAMQSYLGIKDQLVGKTSTAESLETLDLDLLKGTNMYKHVWFGGIAFEENSSFQPTESYVAHDRFGKPELVVVVYLRFGGHGKEAAPIAAQMVQKWREIKDKYK